MVPEGVPPWGSAAAQAAGMALIRACSPGQNPSRTYSDNVYCPPPCLPGCDKPLVSALGVEMDLQALHPLPALNIHEAALGNALGGNKV